MIRDTEYLEWELEAYRERDRRRTDEEIERQRERMRQSQLEYEREQRLVETWPESLRKQARLMKAEVDEYDKEHYFADGAMACERALAVWPEMERAHRARLAELEGFIKYLKEQITAINDQIRRDVGMQLLIESPGEKRHGWNGVGETLVNGGDPEEWLQW